MQLTHFTDYALRALMYLAARPDEMSSVKEISEHYGISRNHMVKIAHRLSQLGYIETAKGKGGGIRIAKNAELLRLGDLIAEFEPNMLLVECFDPKTNTCLISGTCQLKHYLSDATKNFISSMNRYTLADTVPTKGNPFLSPPAAGNRS